jgi:hypothetical protein
MRVYRAEVEKPATRFVKFLEVSFVMLVKCSMYTQLHLKDHTAESKEPQSEFHVVYDDAYSKDCSVYITLSQLNERKPHSL